MNIFLKIATAVLFLLHAVTMSAQYADYAEINASAMQEPATTSECIWQRMNSYDLFNKIELAANIGTTGLGLEIGTPVTKWARIRTGVDWMRNFSVGMNFGLNSYLDGQVSDKFGKIQELMHDLTGYDMDNKIQMNSKPTITAFRLLVDVYPFQHNRHWHFTAGFFAGSKTVGKSINKMNEMPSLLTLNMYNRLYDEISSPDFVQNIIDKPIYGDIYLDPEVAMTLQDKMLPLGRLGVHIGDFKEGNPYGKEPGSPYMMEPDKDGTVSAKAIVNIFRPYLGFGYEGNLSSDGKWKCSLEAGVKFWGGMPKVVTHEGIALNDLDNLRGKVKEYMDLMKLMVVFPSIAYRISYTF